MTSLSSSRLFAENVHVGAVSYPCDVPTRACEARDEPDPHRLGKTHSDDRNRPRGVLGHQGCGCRRRGDVVITVARIPCLPNGGDDRHGAESIARNSSTTFAGPVVGPSRCSAGPTVSSGRPYWSRNPLLVRIHLIDFDTSPSTIFLCRIYRVPATKLCRAHLRPPLELTKVGDNSIVESCPN